MKVLVTGASGLLGASVATGLLAAGHQVVTLQRRPSGVARARDIISPYGYGGPQYWGIDDPEAAAAEFWPAFDAFAESTGVVSEFIRFSLFDDVLPYPGLTRPRTVNYVSRLPVEAADLWASLAPKVRQNVRKARRCGLTADFDETGERIEDFLRIYTSTMKRHDSNEWYLFGRDFFEQIHRNLAGRFCYVYAVLDGRAVSADLVLLSGSEGYYFLGGTEAHAFGLRPNELVKTEAMDWLRRRGFERYVLGGGRVAGDGLERYKRGFAPDGASMFCTGERVLDTGRYTELTGGRRDQFATAGAEWDESAVFFPAYRRPLPGPDAIPSRAGLVGS